MLNWRTILAAIAAIFPAFDVAASAPDNYPPDVDSFIGRAAHCSRLVATDRELASVWECNKLPADKARLIARYRGKTKIVETLNGDWMLETRRLPVKIQNP